jgi:hypothetical protein
MQAVRHDQDEVNMAKKKNILEILEFDGIPLAEILREAVLNRPMF